MPKVNNTTGNQIVEISGSVSAPQTIDIIIAGVSYPQIKAVIAASSSGNNVMVAAHATKKTVLVSLFMVVTADVTVKFQRATTDITGAMPILAKSGLVLNPNAAGWFETGTNEALNINLGGAIVVGGAINYIQV